MIDDATFFYARVGIKALTHDDSPTRQSLLDTFLPPAPFLAPPPAAAPPRLAPWPDDPRLSALSVSRLQLLPGERRGPVVAVLVVVPVSRRARRHDGRGTRAAAGLALPRGSHGPGRAEHLGHVVRRRGRGVHLQDLVPIVAR